MGDFVHLEWFLLFFEPWRKFIEISYSIFLCLGIHFFSFFMWNHTIFDWSNSIFPIKKNVLTLIPEELLDSRCFNFIKPERQGRYEFQNLLSFLVFRTNFRLSFKLQEHARVVAQDMYTMLDNSRFRIIELHHRNKKIYDSITK